MLIVICFFSFRFISFDFVSCNQRTHLTQLDLPVLVSLDLDWKSLQFFSLMFMGRVVRVFDCVCVCQPDSIFVESECEFERARINCQMIAYQFDCNVAMFSAMLKN